MVGVRVRVRVKVKGRGSIRVRVRSGLGLGLGLGYRICAALNIGSSGTQSWERECVLRDRGTERRFQLRERNLNK